MATAAQPAYDVGILERLNRLSLTRSFTPQIDIDWEQGTTDAEYLSLYPQWSLLAGSGLDRDLDDERRTAFVKYQQMNLMLFTGLLERYGITSLARLYDLDCRDEFTEYVGHFMKEEIYHQMMFQRAAAAIGASMPDRPALPIAALDCTMRWVFRLLNVIPSRKLRVTLTFTIFRFAERVSILAHQVVNSTIPRRESLISQVWAFHALDEARHVAFDTMVLEQNRLSWPMTWISRLLAAPSCACMSLVLNANEIWAARQLGVRVGLWQLPGLMRRTTAPFKRRVFALWSEALHSEDTSSA